MIFWKGKMMDLHPDRLERRLNDMIACDTRPAEMRDRFSRRHGKKRTHIKSVRVISAELAGAAALPTKQVTQDSVANMGNSTWGTLRGGPLTAEAINQGMLADCYLLIAMYLVARLRPNFFDDIFVPLDDKTVVVQWFYAGYVIQVKTSLLISTDYDHPSNGDIRPELAEKTYCLIKAGVSDYAADNMGLMHSVFYSLGLDASWGTLDAGAIIAAMQAGKAVGLQTQPTASGKNSLEEWIASHAYGVIGFDAAKKELTLAQPWYAVRAIAGVDAATVANTKLFNSVQIGAFPAQPRILASMVQKAPVDAVKPAPAGTIAVPAGGVTFGAQQASALVNCRLETQGGKQDIGYVIGAAWCEFQLNVASAGTYTLSISVAAVGLGEIDVAVNGAVQAKAVEVPNTGSWNKFVPLAVVLKLPAGAATVRISNRFGTQYNIGDLSLTPGGVLADDPIVSIAVVTTRKSGAVATTAVG
jgi:hypothetical protein